MDLIVAWSHVCIQDENWRRRPSACVCKNGQSHHIALSSWWSKSCSTMSAESMGVKDRESYMSPETNRCKDQNFLFEGMILSQASMKVEYQGWSKPLSFTVSVEPISRKKLHCKFLGVYGRSLCCTAS